MWVRVTHAESGKQMDVNLTWVKGIFPMDGGRTEIAVDPGLMYYVMETPEQIWAAIKASVQKPFKAGEYEPFIQVAPITKLTKTSPRKRK